eukprot:1157018-Pelagomonas_calceolata.AAC.4
MTAQAAPVYPVHLLADPAFGMAAAQATFGRWQEGCSQRTDKRQTQRALKGCKVTAEHTIWQTGQLGKELRRPKLETSVKRYKLEGGIKSNGPICRTKQVVRGHSEATGCYWTGLVTDTFFASAPCRQEHVGKRVNGALKPGQSSCIMSTGTCKCAHM